MSYITFKQKSSPSIMYLIVIIIVCSIFAGYYYNLRTSLTVYPIRKSNTSRFNLTSLGKCGFRNDLGETSRTLIVYVFGKTHAFAERNLDFFIRTAVCQSHHADYYFILQQINNEIFDEKKLPILPSNAHYIQHPNECFDLGTIGWFLSNGTIDKSRYKYFIFLNSSIRGPFIVSYYDSPIWYTIFTRRLNDNIKLVGCTISCEITAHVQSYFWALYLETFDFLLENTDVFECHKTIDDTINHGEVTASKRLLDSGYGIDSLMTKYQGVDFRYNRAAKCVDRANPTYAKAADGITIDAFEVVFVKMKYGTLAYHDKFERVDVYEKWTH